MQHTERKAEACKAIKLQPKSSVWIRLPQHRGNVRWSEANVLAIQLVPAYLKGNHRCCTESTIMQRAECLGRRSWWAIQSCYRPKQSQSTSVCQSRIQASILCPHGNHVNAPQSNQSIIKCRTRLKPSNKIQQDSICIHHLNPQKQLDSQWKEAEDHSVLRVHASRRILPERNLCASNGQDNRRQQHVSHKEQQWGILHEGDVHAHSSQCPYFEHLRGKRSWSLLAHELVVCAAAYSIHWRNNRERSGKHGSADVATNAKWPLCNSWILCWVGEEVPLRNQTVRSEIPSHLFPGIEPWSATNADHRPKGSGG